MGVAKPTPSQTLGSLQAPWERGPCLALCPQISACCWHIDALGKYWLSAWLTGLQASQVAPQHVPVSPLVRRQWHLLLTQASGHNPKNARHPCLYSQAVVPLSTPAGGGTLYGNLGSRPGWKRAENGGLHLPYSRFYSSFKATPGCDTRRVTLIEHLLCAGGLCT